ncbi:MAG TPA: zinc dependent phospholipase C family protein [Anaerolineales bacterium]|jgi:hypothetical protein
MATWIAHLRLAEELLTQLPDLDASQFAIGNIAPDSGIPDDNWENFTPPPAITHFQNSLSSQRDNFDLEFYRGYLANVDPSNTPKFSFRLGYFFHLITDNLWSRLVGRPTMQRLSAKFGADPKFIWTVKEDWYGLDFVYLRDHPDSLFWRVFLEAQPTAFDLDFISREAIERQLQYIKTYYQRQDGEIQALYDRPYIYLSQAEMDRFVNQAAVDLRVIHQLLWPKPPDLTGKSSALELLQPTRQRMP